MKVLIGCERFGVLRDEFEKQGHDAWSCDLVDAPGKHFKRDVRDVANQGGWDLFIVHPDCTFLTIANTYGKRGCSKYTPAQFDVYRAAAVAFFMDCVELVEEVGKGVIENPVGIMSTRYRKPDQIIQPYQFGEDASKKTCLWLWGVRPLIPTVPVFGKYVCKCGARFYVDEDCPNCGPENQRILNTKPVWANQTPSNQNRLGPREGRAMERAKTYVGIARAMAHQWGCPTDPELRPSALAGGAW